MKSHEELSPEKPSWISLIYKENHDGHLQIVISNLNLACLNRVTLDCIGFVDVFS